MAGLAQHDILENIFIKENFTQKHTKLYLNIIYEIYIFLTFMNQEKNKKILNHELYCHVFSSDYVNLTKPNPTQPNPTQPTSLVCAVGTRVADVDLKLFLPPSLNNIFNKHNVTKHVKMNMADAATATATLIKRKYIEQVSTASPGLCQLVLVSTKATPGASPVLVVMLLVIAVTKTPFFMLMSCQLSGTS